MNDLVLRKALYIAARDYALGVFDEVALLKQINKWVREALELRSEAKQRPDAKTCDEQILRSLAETEAEADETWNKLTASAT